MKAYYKKFLILVFCFSLHGTANATLLFGQSHLPIKSVQGQASENPYVGQSSTAGVDGLLSRIDGLIARSQAVNVDMELILVKLAPDWDEIIRFASRRAPAMNNLNVGSWI